MVSEVLSFHGGAPAPPASRLLPPRSEVRWYVLLFENHGFGGATWPRGMIECTSFARAKNVGRMLCSYYDYGCIIDALDIRSGEILETYEYGYL